MAVDVARRVSRVVRELELDGDARDGNATHEATACEPARGVAPPGAAAELLPRVSGRIAQDDVEIDLAAVAWRQLVWPAAAVNAIIVLAGLVTFGRDGRMANGLTVVAYNLKDVNPGDGGFACVPGTVGRAPTWIR